MMRWFRRLNDEPIDTLTPAEAIAIDTVTIKVNLDGHCIWTVDIRISDIEPNGKIDIDIPIGGK